MVVHGIVDFVAEPAIELRRVALHVHDRPARGEGRDVSRGMPRRAGGELVLLQEQTVRPPLLREVKEAGCTDRPAPDDDRTCSARKLGQGPFPPLAEANRPAAKRGRRPFAKCRRSVLAPARRQPGTARSLLAPQLDQRRKSSGRRPTGRHYGIISSPAQDVFGSFFVRVELPENRTMNSIFVPSVRSFPQIAIRRRRIRNKTCRESFSRVIEQGSTIRAVRGSRGRNGNAG